MKIKELLSLVSKEQRKQEKMKAAKKVALGMGIVAAAGVATGILLAQKSGKETRNIMRNKAVNTFGTIKYTIQKSAEKVEDSAAHAAHHIHNAFRDAHSEVKEDIDQTVENLKKDAHEHIEDVKKDIDTGYQEVKKDVHKTGENLSKELNKSAK